jgi:hypothetical protein
MICAALIIIIVIGVSWWLAKGDDSQASVIFGNGREQVADIQPGVSGTGTVMPVAGGDNEISVASSSLNVGSQNSQEDLSGTVGITEPVTAEVLIARIDEAGNKAETEDGTTVSENRSRSLSLLPEAIGSENTEILAETVTDDQADTATAMETATQVSPAKTPGNQQAAVVNENFPRDSQSGSDNLEHALAMPASKPPEYNVTRVGNHRSVSLESEGDDMLEAHFLGDSWVEINNSNSIRLYNDMLRLGDDLTIKGSAPFNVLFGDATVVEVKLNAAEVDISARVRSDNSARVILQPEN